MPQPPAPQSSWEINRIGTIHSVFKQKFGIPRQAGLVPAAEAWIEIDEPYNKIEAFEGLAEFSHIWVLFVFHANQQGHGKLGVRPPKLGGKTRRGVFSSRSNYRPNPIGMSAVKLEHAQIENGDVCLKVSGGDFLDGTPVIDIKPYVGYADLLPQAAEGYASASPTLPPSICFSSAAEAQCAGLQTDSRPQLKALIEQLLLQDPRPAYYRNGIEQKAFATRIFDLDLKWKVQGNSVKVIELLVVK